MSDITSKFIKALHHFIQEPDEDKCIELYIEMSSLVSTELADKDAQDVDRAKEELGSLVKQHDPDGKLDFALFWKGVLEDITPQEELFSTKLTKKLPTVGRIIHLLFLVLAAIAAFVIILGGGTRLGMWLKGF